MQKIANGEMYITPATIDDPATFVEIETALSQAGYAHKHPWPHPSTPYEMT